MEITRRHLMGMASGGVGAPLALWGFLGAMGQAERRGFDEGHTEGWNRALRSTGGFDPTVSDTQIHHAEQERTVAPENHHAYSVTIPNKEALLQYVAISQEHLDYYVMTREDYKSYAEDDGNTKFLRLFSRQDTSEAIVQRVVQPGEYVIVVDNTRAGRRGTAATSVEYGIQIDAFQRDDDGYRETE